MQPEGAAAVAGAMNGALQRKCVAVRALMTKASGDEIRTRYEIARIILAIQNAPDRYGSRGVDKLALALRCDRATLYRYGQVARAFDMKDMRSVLHKQRRERGTLSWSHLIVLSCVNDRAERLRLLGLAIAGLSVRDLEKETHVHSDQQPSGVASVAVRQFLTRTETFKSRAMIEIDLSVATAVDIDRLVRSQEELREICDRNLRALRDARVDAERKKNPGGVHQGERRRLPRLLAG